MVRILIADDNGPVRSRLRSLLSECPGWSVCGEAVDGVEAVEKTKALKPDVVLMDVSMPRMDGLKATRIIHRDMPEIRIIVVSQNDLSITSRQAADTGAKAAVSKLDVCEELIPAIEKVLAA